MKFFRWLAGFLEMRSVQSSTRLCALAYTGASIVYAFGAKPDPVILAQLLAAAALFAGLRKSPEVTP